jgi:hypothetical protein
MGYRSIFKIDPHLFFTLASVSCHETDIGHVKKYEGTHLGKEFLPAESLQEQAVLQCVESGLFPAS